MAYELNSIDWMEAFYTEVERLFDGILPRTFNIDLIPYCPQMPPGEAARNYFVGYYENQMIGD